MLHFCSKPTRQARTLRRQKTVHRQGSLERGRQVLGRSRPEMNVRGGLRNLCKDCGVHFV